MAAAAPIASSGGVTGSMAAVSVQQPEPDLAGRRVQMCIRDRYYEVSMGDAWVWDMYRPARFVKSAKVLTFRDVSIEEIAHSDLKVPDHL